MKFGDGQDGSFCEVVEEWCLFGHWRKVRSGIMGGFSDTNKSLLRLLLQLLQNFVATTWVKMFIGKSVKM